ncbi:hypothetical protein [Mucilaginibacter sp. 21P]|uniref:hypothetical protein n=1 Tax=Mucilaginibacter sp. 21P TaxID=2778902 RepID=UPI001C585F02|nr:hypothetical protein [Mucilaginibacter sp. 21P]
MAAVAMILGVGSALISAAAPSHFANKVWGHRSDGSYVDLTGKTPADYSCTSSSAVCTATYPQNQNPNVNPANPISTTSGTFSGL